MRQTIESFDRSVSNAQNAYPLSTLFFHFSIKGKVKFLQIKQDSIRQNYCQIHEKRCKYVRTNEAWHPLIYAAVCILDDWPIPHQFRTYLIDGPFLNQKRHIATYKILIHWNINIRKNKFLYEKINGSVGRNKHSREQH